MSSVVPPLVPPAHGQRRPVAYLNEDFLNSVDARAIRILSEFLEPLAHFRREKIRDTVVFFGSARIEEGLRLAELHGLFGHGWPSKCGRPRTRQRCGDRKACAFRCEPPLCQ